MWLVHVCRALVGDQSRTLLLVQDYRAQQYSLSGDHPLLLLLDNTSNPRDNGSVVTSRCGRHVHKLDERRFSMYSAHLRDMYNFDPAAVEQFLKEMRLLSAEGQTAAQAMKSKLIPLSGIVTNNTNTNAHASGEDGEGKDEAEGRVAANSSNANERDRKRGGAGNNPAGVDQPRGPQRCFISFEKPDVTDPAEW